MCKCGPNIGDKVDVDAIVNEARGIEGVVTPKSLNPHGLAKNVKPMLVAM